MKLIKAAVSPEIVEEARINPSTKEKLYLDDIRPLALSLIYKFDIPQQDVQDILQEMYIGYEWGLSHFKSGVGTNFTTYMYRIFRSNLSNYFKQQEKIRENIKFMPPPSVDKPTQFTLEGLPFLGLDPEDQYIYQEYVRVLEDLLVTLPEFERRVLTLLMEGKKITEVAKELGVNVQKITALVRIPDGSIYQKVKNVIARYTRRMKIAQEPDEIEDLDEPEDPFTSDETFPSPGGLEGAPKKEIPGEEVKDFDTQARELVLSDLKQIRSLYKIENKKEFLEKLSEWGWSKERLIELFEDAYEEIFEF